MDGIALVVGSMAPDLAYVFNGSRVSVWAHGFPGVVVFCVPVTLAVSLVVARLLSPVFWDHLPDVKPFRLHDYRGLTVHRFAWGGAALSALIGALSHVMLDHFTHDWGWFAQHLNWYNSVLVDDFLGRQWTVFRIIQYIGHVVGTVVCVWLLARYGRQRWMASPAAQVEPYPVTVGSTVAVAGAMLAGAVVGIAWILRDRSGSATDVIRVAAVCFVFLLAICLSLQRIRTRRLTPLVPSA